MQVSGYSGNLPLSTQIIKKAGQAATSPEAPVTAEQVNRAVDRAADRVAEQQDSQALSQSNRRSAATQLYSATSQQRQIDTIWRSPAKARSTASRARWEQHWNCVTTPVATS